MQNLINSFLSTVTSLLTVVLREVANKQTDKQLDKRRVKHNLLGGVTRTSGNCDALQLEAVRRRASCCGLQLRDP